ncbi:MAG TPA: enoyl-CoA hydratase/isomerase family protein [Virgibacillus sp.]|nr:enoyl-CoA hydratase/isomerase family protein [Virgibacillus sp.]
MAMVTYERHEYGFGVIRLNRPEKHNAISMDMAELLKRSIQKAKEDTITFLIITGSGDTTFCAGGDLSELHGDLSQDEAFSLLYQMKDVLYRIASFPLPTVCLLNGNAFGGGCELATACDFRFARQGTEYGFIQSKLGILPGWGGGTLLYEKVEPIFAYQWLTEGTKYTAERLHKNGWLQKVIPQDTWGDEGKIMSSFIEKSERQLKMLKEQYLKKCSILSLSAEMNEEVRNAAILWDAHEHKIAVETFLGKEK